MTFSPDFPDSPESRITTEHYHEMVRAGVLIDGDPFELLDGRIVRKDRSMVGEDPTRYAVQHAFVVNMLTSLAARIQSDISFLQIQLPVTLAPWSEPEPDASVIRGSHEDYRYAVPSGADALCVIEAAHGSLDRDQGPKLAAYAGSGIPQYIIVNMQANWVEVYTDPDTATSAYRTKTTVSRGQTIAINLGDGATLEVRAADVLP
jgi:Uma2 family endonuclease